MLAFSFLNPMLLWAAPLAALPVVIHLLNRRRFQRVPWAAMEHLLAALKRNKKRLQMEQWLVLLLRTLAVLLLAMLVARPQLGGGLVGAVTHHVVLLDDSASMQQQSGSVRLWDKAQAEALSLARSLADGGDLLSVVRLCRPGQPDLWAQRCSPELPRRVAQILAGQACTDAAAELGSALQAVRARAAEVEGVGRTDFHLLSDLRAADWIGDDDKPRPALLAQLTAMDLDQERLIAAGMGSRDADNLAVVDVRRVDRVAGAGVPVELAIVVLNFGLDATPAAELAVEIDGKSRIVLPTPPLAPGEAVSIPALHTFHEAGDRLITALLQPVDRYQADDRRTLALPVQASSRVLLVQGEADDDGLGDTRFLQVALDPGGEQASGVEVEVVAESGLGEVELAPFDMVWLCNVPAPSKDIADRLVAYAEQGGGVAIFLGPQADPDRYNEALWRGGAGLLPLPLGEIAGDPDRREHVVLVDRSHPICGKIADVLALLVDNTVLVKRYLTIREAAGTPASVLARMRDADGPPAIVTRACGSGGGNVVLFALSADKRWSNWPDTDVNVVMAHQTHRFAARARPLGDRNLLANGRLLLRLPMSAYRADVLVRSQDPDGEERTFTAVQADGAADLELQLPMAELAASGGYRVELRTHAGTVEQRAFARNPDVAESRLVRLLAADFARAYPKEAQDRVSWRGEGDEATAAAQDGELWRLLGLGMLFALLLETVLAWRFGRR